MATRAGTAISFAIAIGLAACGNSPPAESDPPPAHAQAPASPQADAAAPRNAGVLTMIPADGGVYGGLLGSVDDTGSIPGLPPLPQRGPCEDAIAQVRQLLCRAKIDRGDSPLMDDVRDVVIASCADLSSTAAARSCVAGAKAASALRACPRAARASSPGDCETIRLQELKLELTERACLSGSSPMDKKFDDYLIANIAKWTHPEPWATTCGKQTIPASAMRCVRAAATSEELARCHL